MVRNMKVTQLLLTVPVLMLAQNPSEACDDWNTYEFLSTATVEAVLECLDTGADVNAREPAGGFTPLHWTLRHNNDPAVSLALIEAGADVNAKTTWGGHSVLNFAVYESMPFVAMVLLNAGANPHEPDDDGHTPISNVLVNAEPGSVEEANWIELINMLVEAGANVNDRSVIDLTPLQIAIRGTSIKNTAIIQILIESGANLNARNRTGGTPLHDAVSNYSITVPVIELLVEAGAPLDARDNSGNTPLHIAALEDPTGQIVEFLVEAGASLNARDEVGRSPLHNAATNNSTALRLLLAAGANRDARTSSGATALHFAATVDDDPAMIASLLANGADVHATDQHGATALDFAARYSGDPVIVETLLAAGADPNGTSPGSLAPLHYAASLNASSGIITALVDAGADPNARFQGEFTALHMVAGEDFPAFTDALMGAGTALGTARIRWGRRWADSRPAITRALIAAGADLEARDEEGRTPLHYAAGFNGDPTLVDSMIASGANAAAQDAAGQSVWDYAEENEAIKGSDAYWRLNDARFNSEP